MRGCQPTIWRSVAPIGAGPLAAGEVLSLELSADEHIQWIWCHQGERGSLVIGYRLGPCEAINVLEKQPIGFFPLEERR